MKPPKRAAAVNKKGPRKALRRKASSRGARLPAHTIAEIFRRFSEANPEPKGELEHVNSYTLLVAVALSAQATDAGVIDPAR